MSVKADAAQQRTIVGPRDLASWRAVARPLLLDGVAPPCIRWRDPDDGQAILGGESRVAGDDSVGTEAVGRLFSVPRAYMQLATLALCHRDPGRWDALYRVLWRVSRGETRLLSDASDEDVHRLHMLAKVVKRDAHKMKAFVRFRRVQTRTNDGTIGEHYVAWHRPDYRILPIVGPFFARRFGVMHWTILTPVGSVVWDGTALHYGPPATRREAPSEDVLEDMWRTYYASVFNPARLNPRAMQREMPVRFWGTLPEAEIIDELLKRAPKRVEGMLGATVGDAAGAGSYLPTSPTVSLAQLRDAAATCKGCDLHCRATQTVFGEGPTDAAIMLVGEQPGDHEDVQGRPFVGPAGELLDRALVDAGLRREDLYITNAVKHFKWTPDPRGKRRIHARPSVLEARACRPWLEAELGLVQPRVVVLLGATAGQSLLGAQFRVSTTRGRVLTDTPLAPARVLATMHPSAILRQADEASREREYRAMVADLRLAAGATT